MISITFFLNHTIAYIISLICVSYMHVSSRNNATLTTTNSQTSVVLQFQEKVARSSKLQINTHHHVIGFYKEFLHSKMFEIQQFLITIASSLNNFPALIKFLLYADQLLWSHVLSIIWENLLIRAPTSSLRWSYEKVQIRTEYHFGDPEAWY